MVKRYFVRLCEGIFGAAVEETPSKFELWSSRGYPHFTYQGGVTLETSNHKLLVF